MSEKKQDQNANVIPYDGTYIGAKKGKELSDKKIQADFDKAWKAQRTTLKESQVKLYKDKGTIGLQWQSFIAFDGSKLVEGERIKRSLNQLGRGKFPHTSQSVNDAVAIAKEIDLKIKASSFSWLDFPQWLPKHLQPKQIQSEKPKTIAEWIKDYEADYWSRKEQDKTTKQYYRDERNWKKGKLFYLEFIPDWGETPGKEIFDKACLAYPKSDKRNDCCSVIRSFALFCGLSDYKNFEFRLKKNQIERKAKKVKRSLTEKEIVIWFEKFPDWSANEGKKNQRDLWQWIYGMMATYGFRNHEVLNIYNLDKTYVDEYGKPHYPFTDPILNPRGTIYTEGKAVKRAAFLPHPRKWIEQFNLRSIPKSYYLFLEEIKELNDYEQEKAKQSKIHTFANFLNSHGFTFTAYNLRHAYNVKGHGLGIPVSILAQNLGHNVLQNTTTYLETMGLQSALEALDNWEKRQSGIEDNKLSLESQLEVLRQENEQLKAILQQLLESIKKD